MSKAKTERLLNLVIALLSTRRPLTRSQIRQAVPAYADSAGDEAFERMFERDKDELREMGVPLVTTHEDPLFESEVGYRVDRDAYALPEIGFTPAELAVLSVASRVWEQASLGAAATRAMRKLEAQGVEPDPGSLVGVEPRVRTREPAFAALYAAVRDRVPVRFTYRAASGGEPRERRVQPWGIASWHGRWYLSGHDLDRGALRVFRLSRVEGTVRRDGEPGSYDVPADHDTREVVGAHVPERAPVPVRVRVREGSGVSLRRRATAVGEPVDGWVVLDLLTGDVETLADEVVGLGDAVVAESPPELVAAVVRRLDALLAAGAAAGPAGAPAAAGPVVT